MIAAGCAGRACTKFLSLQLCFVPSQKPARQRPWACRPTVDIQNCHLVHKHSGCTAIRWDAPLTCSACLTGCVMVLRLQKWHSSSTMLGITILTPSKTCGVSGCCCFLSSSAWANSPMNIRLPSGMGLPRYLPANCVARPDRLTLLRLRILLS